MRARSLLLVFLLVPALLAVFAACDDATAPETRIGPPAAPAWTQTDTTSSPMDSTTTTDDGGGLIGGGS